MTGDVVIRQAGSDDYAIYASLFPELGTGDPVPSREWWLLEFAARTLVAERDGVAVAFLRWQLLNGVGYVRQVVTAAAARRQGIGRALMNATAALFRAQGIGSWCLNVNPRNIPAMGLYTSLGLAFAYEAVSVRFPWAQVGTFPRVDVQVREIEPADDGFLEATFDLVPGQLQDGRDNGRVLRCAHRPDDSAAGVAIFNPGFPGAYPFKVSEPGVVRPLLEALQPAADPSYDYMQLVIEDDTATAEMLLGIGALERLRFHHLRGPVPAAE